MNLSASNDRFLFNFPKTFMPTQLKEKYWHYNNRLNTPYEDPLAFIDSTIQSMTIPAPSVDSPTQPYGITDISYRSSTNVQNFFSKDLTITFQLTEGYINYWMLYDILLYWYNFENPQMFIDPFRIVFVDYEGNFMTTLTLKQILFTGLSDLTLDYSDNTPQFKQFTANFKFNLTDFKIEIQ